MSRDLSAPFLPISGYLESTPDRQAALAGDVRADVGIVGGGLTGLSTALALRRAGVDAVVLEREFCGFGASGRNAGHLTPTIGKDLPTLLMLYGEERTAALVRFADHCVRRTEELVAEHAIDCDYTPSGNLMAVVHPKQEKRLRRACRDRPPGRGPRALPRTGRDAVSRVASGVPVRRARRRGRHARPGKDGARLPARRPCRGRTHLRGHARHRGRRRVRAPMVRTDARHAACRPRRHGEQRLDARDRRARGQDRPPLRDPLRDGAALRRAARRARRLAAPRGHLHRARGPRELSTDHTANDRRGIQGAAIRLGSAAWRPRRPRRALSGRSWCVDSATAFPPLARGSDCALLGRVDRHDPELPAVDRSRLDRTDDCWHALGYNGHGVAQATAVGDILADGITGKDNEWARVFRKAAPTLPPEPFLWLTARGLLGLFSAIDRVTDSQIRFSRGE